MPMLAASALKMRLPAVSMETMRWFPVSATQMLPSGATVTPHGARKLCCVPVPTGVVMTVQTPDVERLWMRLLRVSATHTVPSGATEMPVGLFRSPAGDVAGVVDVEGAVGPERDALRQVELSARGTVAAEDEDRRARR